MNKELIRKALSDAYDLLQQEGESVCSDCLMKEYEHILDTLTLAIQEMDKD